jgi:hypothetical protein
MEKLISLKYSVIIHIMLCALSFENEEKFIRQIFYIPFSSHPQCAVFNGVENQAGFYRDEVYTNTLILITDYSFEIKLTDLNAMQ